MTDQFEIRFIGEEKIEGTKGSTMSFVQEYKYELINVPIPIFLISKFIPEIGSIHPVYPFATVNDLKMSKNISTNSGCGITLSVTYDVLSVDEKAGEHPDIDSLISSNYPFNLPIQDLKFEPVLVDEARRYLFQQGEKKDDDIIENEYDEELDPDDDEAWRKRAFVTTSGTVLQGTKHRTLVSISFWYYTDTQDIDEFEVETKFTEAINSDEVKIGNRTYDKWTLKIESIEVEDKTWNELELKVIKLKLLFDLQTWEKKFENVSTMFMNYPYDWENNSSYPEKTRLRFDEETKQPLYIIPVPADIPKPEDEISPVRIFCTLYDPEPINEGTSSEPIWISDPTKATQFFGSREDCFRLNPDSEPSEVTEPMYLDANGFMLYPDAKTGKVNTNLSPKITGCIFVPLNFNELHIPGN
jgi:hypothetical protein